jgi:large subunit ribosomal protein L3
MGSAGGSQGSGSRVHPGKAMAGRMGGIQHTVQNLKVLQVDEENGIVVVKGEFLLLVLAGTVVANKCFAGCVSGPKKCFVKIQDARKKPWQIVDMSLPTMSAPTLTEVPSETAPAV